MLRFVSILSAAVVAGSAAQAAVVGFSATLSGDDNVPTLTLNNTSAAALISEMSITIGNTGYNYDAIYGFTAPTGGTMTRLTGDDNGGGGERVNIAKISFTGFDPSESASLELDVDVDDRDTLENYWQVLFNNGAAENAVTTVTFSTGQVLSATWPDDASNLSSYTVSAETGAAIPLPSSVLLLAGGLGALGLGARRRTR